MSGGFYYFVGWIQSYGKLCGTMVSCDLKFAVPNGDQR